MSRYERNSDSSTSVTPGDAAGAAAAVTLAWEWSPGSDRM
jgi:hypothetical protein